MKKRKKILTLLLGLGILITLAHTFFAFYSVSQNSGISGNTIFEDLKENYNQMGVGSRIIVFSEWLIIILIILYMLIKGKMGLNKDEKIEQNLKNKRKEIQHSKTLSETDLDVLHNILKDKKILRIATISETFGIDKKTAMDWCMVLEEGNIASINYPLVGSPKIELNSPPTVKNIKTKKVLEKNKKTPLPKQSKEKSEKIKEKIKVPAKKSIKNKKNTKVKKIILKGKQDKKNKK